jgi:hypothetical protein
MVKPPDFRQFLNDRQRRRLYAVRMQLKEALQTYRADRSPRNRQKLREALFAFRYLRRYPLAPFSVRLPGRPRRKGPKIKPVLPPRLAALQKLRRPKRAKSGVVYKSTALRPNSVQGGLPGLGKRA